MVAGVGVVVLELVLHHMVEDWEVLVHRTEPMLQVTELAEVAVDTVQHIQGVPEVPVS